MKHDAFMKRVLTLSPIDPCHDAGGAAEANRPSGNDTKSAIPRTFPQATSNAAILVGPWPR
jgi:hypothetical protein